MTCTCLFFYFFLPRVLNETSENKRRRIRRAQNSQEQSRTGFILCFLVISMSAKIETQKKFLRIFNFTSFFFFLSSRVRLCILESKRCLKGDMAVLDRLLSWQPALLTPSYRRLSPPTFAQNKPITQKWQTFC